MSFVIPQLVFDTYYEAVDAMIDDNFGVNCTLEYPPIKSICTNCYFNPQTGASSNKYKPGGPIAFDDQICPFCNGDGYTTVTETEDIMLRCYFDKKSWMKFPVDFKVSEGSMQTYGHIEDMPKCLRANTMLVNTAQAGYGILRYQLAGSPVHHGLRKNKYFIAVWNLVE